MTANIEIAVRSTVQQDFSRKVGQYLPIFWPKCLDPALARISRWRGADWPLDSKMGFAESFRVQRSEFQLRALSVLRLFGLRAPALPAIGPPSEEICRLRTTLDQPIGVRIPGRDSLAPLNLFVATSRSVQACPLFGLQSLNPERR